ncbi:MAG: GTP 3',8-cyclase MoaA [Cyanobacteria bacterium REEB67]|nr:GTP 3',8-cyclase MoaA [Cyanobacteria bacterium REEB67]
MAAPQTLANRLVDGFGREHTYLRISVTDRCNLRCTYCMPVEGLAWKKRQELLTFEEIERVAAIFIEMGVTKIRLTGGEPMVRKDLPLLIRGLGRMDGLKTLAMTTNATLLAGHVEDLYASGLSQLNISLDSFKPERFSAIARQDVKVFDAVMAGIDGALKQNFASVKINVVVMSGVNDDEILDFVEFAAKNRVNVRFIEYMPFKDNQWTNEKVVTYKDMLALIGEHYQLRKLEDDRSAVGKDYAIEGGIGTVSFISSMSDSFCSTCNRLRLTADGQVKSCLFYPAETNLRDAMRLGATDSTLQGMILDSLRMKPEAHPPAEEIAANDNRAMIEIGG